MNEFTVAGNTLPMLLLVGAMLAAVLARAARGARRHAVQELCRSRGTPELFERIVEASETIAFLAATAVVVVTVAATAAIVRRTGTSDAGTAGSVAALAAWTLAAWIALVVVPVAVTRAVGPRVIIAAWPLCRPLVAAVTPFVHAISDVSSRFGRRGRRLADVEAEAIGSELKLVVDEAHREGRLEAGARAMIEGVIDLDEVRVGEIMTPRTAMISLGLATPWDEAVRTVSESGHTRIPVWDRTPDDVIGILHSRELLVELCKPEESRRFELRPLLRPPYFVPESKSVLKLLREFQRTCTHLAVVTDEFGGVSGVVTIEDALEEIVGEIADEHDDAVTDGIRILGNGACEVRAAVRIAELNERMGFALPDETDFETIGGLVFHRIGRIPQAGERIDVDGVAVEVLSATRSRIEWLRVESRRDGGPAK